MNDPDTWLFGSLIIAMSSGMVGHIFGGLNKVSEKTCCERRANDKEILAERIDHLCNLIKNLDEKFELKYNKD